MKEFQSPAGWLRKFQNAFRGLAQGIQGQNSWLVHIPVAGAVIAAPLRNLRLELSSMVSVWVCKSRSGTPFRVVMCSS